MRWHIQGPGHSANFFGKFTVREIIAKPLCRVERFPEYESENWRGNLDEYYGL